MAHSAQISPMVPALTRRKNRNPLPGSGLSIGYTLAYLGLLVIVPLSTIIFKTASLSWNEFWHTVTDARSLSAYALSLTCSLSAAVINGVFGTILAWVLVRYRFFGKRILDAIIDLPFAVPTAVAGIALTAVWGPNGPLGGPLNDAGIQVAYARLGVLIAMIFVGLPFFVRTLQPVFENLDPELEEAAATMGAGKRYTFFRVIVPALAPALFTGFTLSFARALGEYGSIVFISGNMPFRTEITPLLIMTKLEQFDYAGATALAAVMLLASFTVLFIVNTMQWRQRNHRKMWIRMPRRRSFLKG